MKKNLKNVHDVIKPHGRGEYFPETNLLKFFFPPEIYFLFFTRNLQKIIS